MNFEHTEDRRMLADSLNRFIAEQYPVEKRDPIAPSPQGFSSSIWKKFADIGVIGALFSEADGGFGGDGFDIAVVFEALGKGLVVEPMLGTLMAGRALASIGSEKQKAMLASVIDGSQLIALAHDEPGASHEPSRVVTRGARNQEGWVLQGVKAAIAQGEHADWFLISARTSGADDDQAGISLFCIAAKSPGVVIRGCGAIDGGRVAEITLQGTQVSADALIGVEGKGFDALHSALQLGLLALSSESLGAMEVAKAATLEYLSVRKQFGVAIGSFQALQHRMANLLLEVEQARSAVINAAAALNSDSVTSARAMSAAKYTVGRVGILMAEEAIQMHGGIGMTWELPLAHYAKRLVMIDHQLGDEDFHLSRFIELGKRISA